MSAAANASGQLINLTYVINAFLFSMIGMGVFGFGFWIFDRITPFSLWKEIIDEHNVALAIIAGSVAIGICQIIASAIHS
jgi:putative membrane protein